MPIDPRRPLEPPPEHLKTRDGLRVGGAVLVAAGGLCVLVAGIDFFSAFASFRSGPGRSRTPELFWLFFVGFPLLAGGMTMLKFGFMGAVAKYGVREAAPAAAEGVNRVGMGAAPGISAIAAAVGEGLRGRGGGGVGVGVGVGARCGACGSGQDADAKFCDDCGAPMGTRCPACGAACAPDARFCVRCGSALT
jgi:hypothetical protein